MAKNISLHLYRDTQKQHRWRAYKNGRILADSGQGYAHRADCISSMRRVLGLGEIVWHGESKTTMYGQTVRGRAEEPAELIEVHVFKKTWDADVEMMKNG